MQYLVTWDIEIDADSPREAVEEALKIQRDQLSTATVFKVSDENGKCWQVDLYAEPRWKVELCRQP